MLVFVVFNHMRVLLFQLTKGGEVESLWGQATPGLGFDPSGSGCRWATLISVPGSQSCEK